MLAAHIILLILPCGDSFSGPEVIKRFSYSTQLGIKFALLINLKLLTIANPFMLNIAEHEIYLQINMKMPTVVGIFTIIGIFIFICREKIHAQLS